MIYIKLFSEGEECGKISWKIDLRQTSKNLSTVSVDFKFQTYENGNVSVTLKSDVKGLLLSIGKLARIFRNNKNGLSWKMGQRSRLFQVHLEYFLLI